MSHHGDDVIRAGTGGRRAARQPLDPVLSDSVDLFRWAHEMHGDGLCITSSFGDPILAHLANLSIPGVEVTLLDTGYLFAETEWYAADLARRFRINLRVVRAPADATPDLWQTDTDACCGQRKVATLEWALGGRSAWVTGVRRSDSLSRSGTSPVADDPQRGVVKVNPLATWRDDDVERYRRVFGLPEHPLADRGYPSIGCWPCTRPANDPTDPRSGRWAHSEKTECGLHLAVPVAVTNR